MPPFSVGSAQVEERLRVVRRRLNLVTLQDALYLSGSLVTLAVTVLVVVALRGRGSLFGVTAWAAIACIAAAGVAAALRIRQHWLSLEQVVRFADRKAALDDRLATLLLDPRRTRSSALKDMLLEQILAATPRWDVDVLVPRRVPRSAFVLGASLAALIALSFFARPPATPQPASVTHPPSRADLGDAAPPPHDASEHAPHDGGLPGSGAAMQTAGLAGARQGGQPGQALSMSQATGTQSGGARNGRSATEAGNGVHGDDAAAGAMHGGASVSTDAGQSRDMTEELRKAIREALGAESGQPEMLAKSESTGEGQSPGTNHSNDAADDPADAGRGTSRDGKPGESAGARASDANNREGAARSLAQSGASNQLPGGGSASNPGALGGSSSTELFGNAPGARMAGSEAPNLGIKLSAFGALNAGQAEPQHDTPPPGSAGVGLPGHASSPALTDEQVPDAPLQKAEVAPEHEAVVRRIFTRDE
jgi:hypothetical protein